MGLDITFKRARDIKCPKCGEVVFRETVDSVSTGGRAWYDVLEKIGYYKPFDKRAEDDFDWYGKDMVLTDEQALHIAGNVPECYNQQEVENMIYATVFRKDKLIVNADW